MSAFKQNNGHDPVVNQHLILLAEDHPLNQKVAVLLLERMGFDVHVVSNGAQAVEAVKSNAYDAVLMDCQMPELDGFDATRLIREHELKTHQHVPIIAVTALAMSGDRERCLAAGMDDYITKPIDRELLRQKLVYWLNPGSVAAAINSSKVIPLFESSFSLAGERDEPIHIGRLHESYGDEAADLLVLFQHSSERLLAQLKQSIEDEDGAAIGKLAHELKGASWAIGAEEMARLSVFIEQAAAQQNWRIIQRTFARLNHHFEHVKAFVDSRISQVPEVKHM